jgi:hypothetical protein
LAARPVSFWSLLNRSPVEWQRAANLVHQADLD